jgi:hypothetical protein
MAYERVPSGLASFVCNLHIASEMRLLIVPSGTPSSCAISRAAFNSRASRRPRYSGWGNAIRARARRARSLPRTVLDGPTHPCMPAAAYAPT